jgi:hypothetical protein
VLLHDGGDLLEILLVDGGSHVEHRAWRADS